MLKESKLKEILEKALHGESPNREECKYLLSFDEKSLEASFIRSVANEVIRKKSDNSAIILGQIGVDVAPCKGGCSFCNFGEEHNDIEEKRLSDEEIEQKVQEFSKQGDLYGLFLMTMHDYDLDVFLNSVEISRKIIPESTKIWSNVGDSSLANYKAMKAAGVEGVYHVCRIGEGRDTKLEPDDRIKSMERIIEAGLKLYTCCEPIGPEHTIDEIVDNMFIGIDLGCTQHAAMRRTAVEGTPLAKYGQISELRLGQMVAVVTLASFDTPTMTYSGVHEPNKIAYISGANIITAETGANPRDTTSETSKNRGLDTNDCRKMLLECGFDYIRRGDESKIKLDLDYIKGCQ